MFDSLNELSKAVASVRCPKGSSGAYGMSCIARSLDLWETRSTLASLRLCSGDWKTGFALCAPKL